MDSEVIVARVMLVNKRTRNIFQNCRTYEWNFNTPRPLDRFRLSSNLFWTGFESNLVSTVSSSHSRQASRSFPLERVVLLVARSTVAKRTLINSMCLVLRVEPLRLIIPSAKEDSQHRIWCVVVCVSSALHPNFSDQFNCCLWSMTPQAPDNAATNSAPPLLSANVDCFARRGDWAPIKVALHP